MKEPAAGDPARQRRLLILLIPGLFVLAGFAWFFGRQAVPPVPESPATTEEFEKDLINTARREEFRRRTLSRREQAHKEGYGPDAEYDDAVRFVEQGLVEEAGALLAELLQSKPGHVRAMIELGMLELLDKDRPAIALDWFRKALQANGGNPGLIREVVAVYRDLGRESEGIEFLRDLRVEFPGQDAIPYGIAVLSLHKGDTRQAIAWFETALDDGYERHAVFAGIGKAHQISGRRAEAARFYQIAIRGYEEETRDRMIRQEPFELQALALDDLQFRLAEIYLELGEFEKASASAAKLAEKMPADPRVISLLDRVRGMPRG